MKNEVSIRYAEGLFELARENNTVKEKKEQAEFFLDIAEEEPDFLALFGAVRITKAEKKKFIEEIFHDKFDNEMISLCKLLIDKNRMVYVKEIFDEYVRLANEELNIEKATVYSARKLSQEDLDRIRVALEKQSGNQVLLENKVDESLIAGIKVTVGNKVTDITVKNEMDNMKQAILKGGRS